jgi:RNA polymerase sigma-70 factor (ECF subfamily)
VFWKGSGRAEASPVVVPFDVDRSAVEAAKRDPDAFEPLYRRYVAHIYSLAYYETRDPHTAEDVTEQVFLKALAALPRFREEAVGEGSTFKVWLYAIARNVIANERRQRRRHPTSSLDEALALPAPDDPSGAVEARLEAERVWRAVQSLPDDRRQALQLRIVHELSAREIGLLMGRSEGAVRVLIHRALDAVRRQLAS